MMKNWRWFALGGGLVVAALMLLPSQGCGDDDDDNDARVSGNVASVTGPTASVAPARAPRFAFLDLFRPSEAVAQDTCEAENLFFCLSNGSSEQCTPVSETNCTFAAEIAVNDELGARFVQDDGDGTIEETDPSAEVQGEAVDDVDVCPGVQIVLNDVDIDFDAETATPASAESTGCAEATATPTAAGTSTPTPADTATPEPTATEIPT